MQTTIQLLRTALGDPAFRDAERQHLPALPDTFDVFDVSFKAPRFRGLRPSWRFAILNRAAPASRAGKLSQILADAWSVVESVTPSEFVVFVSDDPGVHLHEEFNVATRPVFCLDAGDLDALGPENSVAPFVLAVKRRWTGVPGLTTQLSPYLQGTPVRDSWQFFGREAQLEQLVYSDHNIVVVGARRIGKTSLLLEACRQMKERGEVAHYTNVQSCTRAHDIVQEIVREVSPQDAAAAARRGKLFGDSLLKHTLRTLTRTHKRITLIIDEMGNALRNMGPDDWGVLGVLRSFAQQGHLRLIVAGFQESLLTAENSFSGPAVNFGDVMRLGHFNDTEVQEFILGPVRFWRRMTDHERRTILESVFSTVGGHPYFLQYYGARLFQTLLRSDPVPEDAVSLLRRQLLETLRVPASEVWEHAQSPTLRFLFLSCCKQADDEGRLRRFTINDDWVRDTLRRIGVKSSLVSRERLLSELSIRGLCVPDPRNPVEYIIGAPAVYLYLKRSESAFGSLDPLIEKLREEVAAPEELDIWQLRVEPQHV